jgi:hypothetical protein
MYRAMLWKTVWCDIIEDLPHPVFGRLFYRRVSLLWCIWHTFFCVLQRYSNISRMESLDEKVLFTFLHCSMWILEDY